MVLRRVVYTVGYGGVELGDLEHLVRSLGIDVVVDVRRWGKSLKRPEFSVENLFRVFSGVGISYIWMPSLGGYRKFGIDVEDVGIGRCFKSEGFRAYATYILTSHEARRALDELLRMCESGKVMLLCREKYPYVCHRKIISDWLLFKGFRVIHVVPPRLFEHRYTKCARVIGTTLTYV